MERSIEIKINKNVFPKLFKLKDEDLKNNINYLLNIGYQNVYSSVSQKNVVNDFKNICREFKDDILNGIEFKNNNLEKNLNIHDKLDKFDTTINKLFGISNTSNKKGEISEKLISEIIKNTYPNYTYDIKRSIAHNADGELFSPSGMKCLVEVKNYTYTINSDEIVKFKNDLKTNNQKLGIFISLQTNICGKKLIDYEVYDDIHIVYISNIINDLNKLDCAILLMENINKILKKDNIEIKINQIKETIYNNFNELENLVNKIKKLRSNYTVIEKNIKNNLDDFYNNLREYELDVKSKMQSVWDGLFKNLEDIDKKYLDESSLILKKLSKKDKSFNLISKIIDFCSQNNINISQNKNIYNLIYKTENIGYFKKMTNKIQLSIKKLNLIINADFKNNDIIEFYLDTLKKNILV